MPLCIILVWVLASTGLAKVDKDMRRKLMIASVGFSVFMSLLVVHFLGMPYTWLRFLRKSDLNDTDMPLTSTPSEEVIYPSQQLRHPAAHIAYIKTHKTGSSTIWSILVTYALENNLTIAIPATRQGNKLGWPKSFTPADAVPPKPDLLCYHSRFSSAMLDYMPEDTIYLSSVRDPATQLLSAYQYFGASSCFNMSFTEFLDRPSKTASFVGRCSEYYKWWLMNGQMYDLGLDTSLLSSTNPVDRSKVLDVILKLDRQLHMVLVLELLDESLIVMRDLLEWTTLDVVYFRKNFQLGTKVDVTYTESRKAQARKWNWADEMLYSHFRQKLETILSQRPEYYKIEVANLKALSDQWMSRCVRKVIPAALANNKYLKTGYEDNIGTYRLTSNGQHNNKCILLTMTEVAKIRLLNNGSSIDVKTFQGGTILDT